MIPTASSLTIYTVGHSNQSPEEFCQLLEAKGISVVVDVRSKPYSRYARQFNRQALEKFLPECGFPITYSRATFWAACPEGYQGSQSAPGLGPQHSTSSNSQPAAGSIGVLGFDPQGDGNRQRECVGVQLQQSALSTRIKVWEVLDLHQSFYRGTGGL
ncbi:MAG: DUF488 family protein, partial [Thermoleophilia bacterium]|nr:DUF488 family protein [Thermoleophilia bacterium]